MNSITQTFDYEKKQWGAAPITNLYTDFQGLQLAFLKKDLAKTVMKKKLSVLDLGCGGGNIAGFLKGQFPQLAITGIDISTESLRVAKKRFPHVTFLQATAEKIPHSAGTYDLITSFDSLEHFDNLDAVLGEVKRVLKKNGIFYLGVPLERQFPTIYWLLYSFGWRGKKHFSGHVNFFTDKSLETLLENHGFRLVKKRFSFHPIFSFFDVGYYFLQSVMGKPFAFETTITEMRPSFQQKILLLFKQTISVIGYIESSLFWWFPGGKGHFVFVKESADDFFSTNPPLTVAEEQQRRYGLQKAVQPRDIVIQEYLHRLGFEKSRAVLDFGCANGIWLERLLVHTKATGVGVDIADQLIQFANSRKEKKGKYFNSLKKWPVQKNSIDFCFSFDTFEHISDRAPEIKRIYQSMKKGGRFFFYTLNPQNKFTIDWLFEKMGSNYLYERADHKKELFIGPQELEKLLKKAGFQKMHYTLYDGPANLFGRVICFAFLSVMEKIAIAIRVPKLMTYSVLLTDRGVRVFRPCNDFIDGFFLSRGYSNGYFLWGEK